MKGWVKSLLQPSDDAIRGYAASELSLI